MKENKMTTNAETARAEYSLTLFKQNEGLVPVYTGQKFKVVDGNATTELEDFGPGSTLEIAVRTEIQRVMRLNPQLTHVKINFFEKF